MRAAVCIAGLLFAVPPAAAFDYDYDYLRRYVPADDFSPELRTDTTLFYHVPTEDIFARAAAYGFAAFGRRGESAYERTLRADGIDISRAYAPVLNDMQASRRYADGMRSTLSERPSHGEYFSLDTEVEPERYRVAALFSDRSYNGGVRASMSIDAGRGWGVAAALRFATGRDLHVRGVFSDSFAAGIRFYKSFGSRHFLSAVVAAAPSRRGIRTASSEEAFRLTGDCYYNPSWGWCDGRVRNANVRREFMPFAAVTYRYAHSPSVEYSITGAVTAGESRYSALAWFDAYTPAPDAWRKMPSAFDNTAVAMSVEKAWRDGDSRYTQIDWNAMRRANALTAGEAAYALDDRVTRRTRADAVFRADVAFSDRLSLQGGVRVAYERSRRFKELRDMLGAQYVVDVDYFIADDATYGSLSDNDLRNPARRVAQGDRYSYDYAFDNGGIALFAVLTWRGGRWTADATLQAGEHFVRRTGFYEKALFPGGGSAGASRLLTFTPYALRLHAGYSLRAKHCFDFSAYAGADAPDAADCFLQPMYNNRTSDLLTARHIAAAQLSYEYSTRALRLQAAAYILHSSGGVESMRYYDDLSGLYCDMTASGIGTLRYGAEIAAEWTPVRRLVVTAAVAAGDYRYATNPVLNIYADADNSVVCRDIRSYMRGVHTGGGAQIAATLQGAFFAPRAWTLRLAASCTALQYSRPSMLRRTERVLRQTGLSREAAARFAAQKRLPAAFTMDVSLAKRFDFRKGALSLFLSVRNLLDNRNIVLSSSERMRMRGMTEGGKRIYLPQDDLLMYAYGRTFYFSVAYAF